ncbi:Multidrug resistance-associated protein 1 [Physocladia obscura]|uniref:Multidrug resistance-associated protein 1 n=1 Tax=Physocladia obscura TaxID=109957 RepID=A0AAD5STS6_9FUNG|nr:Multidrug resistance-associated protein 1 [Physocladia obscura]
MDTSQLEFKITTAKEPIVWNAYSFSTISWLNPVLRKGFKKPITEEDLPSIGKGEQASALSTWLDEFIAQTHDVAQGKKKRVSLVKTLLPHVVPALIADAISQIISIGASTGQSLVLQQILTHLETVNGQSSGKGYALATLLFCLLVANSISSNISTSIGYVLELRIKSALSSAIYRKALALSAKSRNHYPAGKINTLINSDTSSITNFIDSVNNLWLMPIQVAISIYFVASLLGPATAVAAGVFVSLTLLSSFSSPFLQSSVRQYTESMDKRTTLLREFLYGIKTVKYHGLEENENKKLVAAREIQLKAAYRTALGYSALIGVLILQNALTTPLTLVAFSAFGNLMIPTTIFPALSFLALLQGISGQLPSYFLNISQAMVSYRRISTFLLAEETNLDDAPLIRDASEGKHDAIFYNQTTFSWESVKKTNVNDDGKKTKSKPVGENLELLPTESFSNDVFKLENITLSIKRGDLVAVVGKTGSGKSSLLSSMAGTMRKTCGKATVYGSVSYCPQDPWIFGGTVLENITLLNPNLESSCTDAIQMCSLVKDLNSFSSGIKTHIGEKGINLSGGQKARVALARAIVNDPDIYILDDPLSALDAHVSKAVFEEAIKGPLMKQKTVILATHLLQVLPNVDCIVVMEKGRIVQYGTFAELMTNTGGILFSMMKDYHTSLDSKEEVDMEKLAVNEKMTTSAVENGAFALEDRNMGHVLLSSYKSYLQAIGFTWFIVQIFMVLVLAAGYTAQQLTLSAWTSSYWGLSDTVYLVIYSSLGIIDTIISLVNYAYTMLSAVNAGQYFHDRALSGLMAAPMSFYSSQPVGRILNRMTTDIRTLDTRFGFFLAAIVPQMYASVGILIIACISSWQIIPIIIGLFVALYIVFEYFRRSYRELRRVSLNMLSPLTAHISETLVGIPSILAYKAGKLLIGIQMKKLDDANLGTFLFSSTLYWMTVRFQLIGAVFTFAVALLGVSGIMPYSFVGVALTQVITFAPTIQHALMMISNLESSMANVDRLSFYANNIPKEAARYLPKDGNLQTWPTVGSIKIKNLSLAYDSRPDTLVINKISLQISAREKIGVVGRTGSGKSTLMDSFFRLIEAKEGFIEIDGEDISSIGLKKLRTSIQIIPQSPTLFDGTIRSNIDAFGKYTDFDLWNALECVGLKEYVSALSKGLNSTITEGGTNLSAGQRQLLCLTTVLLEKSKILILDESTSSVDGVSDIRIQNLIKTNFNSTTVLSVAHRLNTIAAFDKVLVLENGSVVEFDAPYVLLQKENSTFREMVNATGSSNAAVIAELAKEHYMRGI